MTIRAIEPSRFAGKKWVERGDFTFAANEMVCLLAPDEVPLASHTFPIGVLEVNGQHQFVALFSLERGNNHFVSPQGRWLARYKPAVFRAYPFKLAETPEKKKVLCFDESSGALAEAGLPFYEDDKVTVSEELSKKIGFINAVENGIKHAGKVAQLFESQKLLVPWITIQESDGDREKTETIHRIDGDKLNELPEKDLVALHEARALPLAYALHFSLANIDFLRRLKTLQDGDLVTGEQNLDGILSDSAHEEHSLNFDNL